MKQAKSPKDKLSIVLGYLNGQDVTNQVLPANNLTFFFIQNPLFSCKINYGTIVKAISNNKGELVLIGIVKASEYKTRQFLLSNNAKDSDFINKIGDPIIAVGGTRELQWAALHLSISRKNQGLT